MHVRFPERRDSGLSPSPPNAKKPPTLHGFREMPGVSGGLAKQVLSQLSYGPLVVRKLRHDAGFRNVVPRAGEGPETAVCESPHLARRLV